MEQVSEFFELHGESRFASYDETQTSKIIYRAGFRKLEDDDTYTYYVLPSSWKNEVCKGLNSKVMADFLLEQGVLVAGSKGKSYTTARLPGMGVQKCYVVNGGAFGDAPEAKAAPSEAGNTCNTGNGIDPADDIPF